MSLECYLNHKITPWTGEHLHRYHEARKYINTGNTVLDLACGTGYGSEILSTINNTVVYGGDIDQGAINYCKKNLGTNASLRFQVMDATDLKFNDNFFDKVVSLETIEYSTAYKKILTQFVRVLKPKGTAIISTPNVTVSSSGGIIVNPYHTQEFTYDELYALLKAEFNNVLIYGQHYSRYIGRQSSKSMYNVERFLLKRGIRKLPYALRNGVFNTLFNYPLYPSCTDFQLFTDKKYIEKNCHVLFAVCTK